MKKGFSVFLVAVMLLSMVACGGDGKEDANIGTYKCTKIEAMGMELSPEEHLGESIVLELSDGGKGTMSGVGTSGNITWKLDGENLEINDGDVAFTGTLKDDVIILDDVETMTMTFEKQ